MLILFFLLGGLVFLTVGTQVFDRAMTALAQHGKFSPAMIRLVLWPLASRLPLVATVLLALVHKHGLLAFSTVVGSVLFSLMATVGLTALIRRMTLIQRTGQREGFLLVAAGAVVALAFHAQPVFGTLPGVGLILLALAVLGYLFSNELPPSHPLPVVKLHPALAMPLLAVGLIFLILGANLLLEGALGLTKHHGWSESLVGLTLMAAATALPEFLPAVAAALTRQPEPPTATLFRANLLSLLGILGLVTLFMPVHVPAHFAWLEGWFLVGVPIALVASGSRKWRLKRAEGFFFLALYGLYLFALVNGHA